MLIYTTQHVFSGICICGHHDYEHHGDCLMNQDAIDAMKSSTMFGECEHYGCNEDWTPCPKCVAGRFIDRDDPLKDAKIAECKI